MKKQKIELSEPTELDHWHLAHTESERFLAEFEHTLICLAQAFDRRIQFLGAFQDQIGQAAGWFLDFADLVDQHALRHRLDRVESIVDRGDKAQDIFGVDGGDEGAR